MEERGRESGRQGEGGGVKRCAVGHTASFNFCHYWIHIFSIIASRKSCNFKSLMQRCQFTSGTSLAPVLAEKTDCLSLSFS